MHSMGTFPLPGGVCIVNGYSSVNQAALSCCIAVPGSQSISFLGVHWPNKAGSALLMVKANSYTDPNNRSCPWNNSLPVSTPRVDGVITCLKLLVAFSVHMGGQNTRVRHFHGEDDTAGHVSEFQCVHTSSIVAMTSLSMHSLVRERESKE